MGMINHRIPKIIKQDVIEVVDFVNTCMMIQSDDQDYLFEVFNKYVKMQWKPDLKKSCNIDRMEVLNKMKQIVSTWKQQEQSS